MVINKKKNRNRHNRALPWGVFFLSPCLCVYPSLCLTRVPQMRFSLLFLINELTSLRCSHAHTTNHTTNQIHARIVYTIHQCIMHASLFKAMTRQRYLSSHSFRQGGASAALTSGCPEWVQKILEGWRNTTWKQYTFLGLEHGRKIIQEMVHAKPTKGVNQGRY